MGDVKDEEFVAFVRSRMLQLRRTAYLLCGDWAHGDDIVQRVLTDMYVRWSKVRRADNVDAYVRTALVNRFIDERRRSWTRVRLVDVVPDERSEEVDSAASLDLRHALGRLPMRQRAVLVLRFLCDMSVDQTAATLECSAGTVKSQTYDGLVAMRRLLSPKQTEVK